jgi:hypothetical protein
MTARIGLEMMGSARTASNTLAVVYGASAGVGGLGIQAANAISDLADAGFRVLAIGPGRSPNVEFPDGVTSRSLPSGISRTVVRYTWLRWLAGRTQYLNDTRLGAAAATMVAQARPDACYCFTQVALESFRWANRVKLPAILESPNGHLRNFRATYVRETRKFGAAPYLGHPTKAMLARVEEEYARADLIRVSSDWAKQTFIAQGVAREKIVVIPQRPTASFCPPAHRLPPVGPFRVCFVGTLDLRKGFVYLLRAMRHFERDQIAVRLVGGTVDRLTRRILAQERLGLNVEVVPGNPLPSLHWAEIFVLPTLEDGSPFAVVEAMAAGLPLVVTDACGNAPLIRNHESGWVVPAADEAALADALHHAYRRRAELPQMGMLARADWERLAAESHTGPLRDLLRESVMRVGEREPIGT